MAEVVINWTQITDLLDGVGTLMPSIVNLVFSILPVIIAFAIAGLIGGLFYVIVEKIRSGF